MIFNFFSKTKKKHTIKMRSRFSVGFVSIMFPLFVVVVLVLYILALNGLSLDQVPSPSMAMLVISVVCLAVSYLASYYLMNQIFLPLEKLNEASKQVAKGDYSGQLTYSGHVEEINSTVENFNLMVQELSSVEIMRKDFIANVSHEFKTPLSSITGYVTLLQDPDLSEEERSEYIQMAFFNIEKLNDLTGNILQLSRLENQSTLSPPVFYRLDEQIREALVLLEPKWTQKQIVLDIDLPQTSYRGQKPLLLQVWTNLIGNAIKFSDSGGTISISLLTSGSYLEVTISDNGIGMDEATQAHIFEKFYQGDSSRRSLGNGLGLPLCKKIVELCGGKICVSSQPGKGSIFIVQLPFILNS